MTREGFCFADPSCGCAANEPCKVDALMARNQVLEAALADLPSPAAFEYVRRLRERHVAQIHVLEDKLSRQIAAHRQTQDRAVKAEHSLRAEEMAHRVTADFRKAAEEELKAVGLIVEGLHKSIRELRNLIAGPDF